MGKKETYLSHLVGFLLSVTLTLAAYFIVLESWLVGSWRFFALILLALLQAWVQLVLFLHLGQRGGWYLRLFLFMGSVLLILLWGTLWIMSNLDSRVMS